ncbi:MAG TPA: M50 family metallopeptidase [Candidatus Saccharimonadales bacterium]|nr:M50 family metallopeptidase [Candidatus Saccharimonadales bacterium]
MQIFVFLMGLLLFIGLVLIHEWGHFIMARRNGVDVEEFGLGFPPRAKGIRLESGMLLSLNWLPLGGFVKMKGEHDSDVKKGSFGAAPLWSKTKILLAGVTMNLIAGLVLLTILAWIGMPKLITQDSVGQDQFTVASDTHITQQKVQTGTFLKDSPAQAAGLRSSDIITAITADGKTTQIHTIRQLHDATASHAGKTVQVTYQRHGHTFTKSIRLTPQAAIDAADKVCQQKNDLSLCKGALGVSPNQLQIQRSTWSAPIVALGLTKQITVLTFQGLGHALGGLGSAIAGLVTNNHQARVNGQESASSQVGGPVAIGVALWDSGSLGFNFMLLLIALISLTLAIMNVLPIPALDGGRLAMVLVSRGLFRRPLSRLAEERIVGASFLIILALVALITLVDVRRFF